MARPAAVLLLLLLIAVVGGERPNVPAPEAPKVEVYSRQHVAAGEENILNCFVSGFHPPQIDIALLKNGEPMSGVQYADMSFNDKWYFQRLVYVPFSPKDGELYVCRVTHAGFSEPRSFQWDPDF
ncbi:beta-2-microglobulin [Cuculus canorus]|nr:beta-2-microglobulin [Cuculus canorus]